MYTVTEVPPQSSHAARPATPLPGAHPPHPQLGRGRKVLGGGKGGGGAAGQAPRQACLLSRPRREGCHPTCPAQNANGLLKGAQSDPGRARVGPRHPGCSLFSSPGLGGGSLLSPPGSPPCSLWGTLAPLLCHLGAWSWGFLRRVLA